MEIRFKWRHLLILIGILAVITVLVDLVRISSYKSLPQRPDKKIQTRQDQVYYDLVNGSKEIDWSQLDGTLEYINGQYDCADFNLVSLIRIIYEYGEIIPAGNMGKIKNTLQNFRYWWDGLPCLVW